MVKFILIFLFIVPSLALVLHSRFSFFIFIRDLISGGTPKSQKEILQIKQEYEKMTSDRLQQLITKEQLSTKEKLIVQIILEER